MKRIGELLLLTITLLACSTTRAAPSPVFPAISAEPHEHFDGGPDSFDLDLHSITFVPHQVVVDGVPETHYRYTVRQIHQLPEDLTEATEWQENDRSLELPAGFTIFGNSATTVTLGDLGIISFNAPKLEFAPTIHAFESSLYRDRFRSLGNDIRARQSAGKLTIQYDHHTNDPDYPTIALHITYQVELFASGMIRISYLGVDDSLSDTDTVVGIYKSDYFDEDLPPRNLPTEVDFSAECLKMSDVVVTEAIGATATFRPKLATTATHTVPLRAVTSDATAVQTLDYQAWDNLHQIPTSASSIYIPVLLASDGTPEAEEYFTLKLVAPEDPNWIYAEARAWIIDATPTPSLSPRMEVAGNRIYLTPPPGDSAGITGFRIVSIAGGTVRLPTSSTPIQPGAVITVAQGSGGLIASGPGVVLRVETIDSGGASSGATYLDVDGTSDAPVFQFARASYEVTEGNSLNLAVVASKPGSGVSYELVEGSAKVSGIASDLVTTPRSLEFRNGRASISIPVLADGLTEGQENFEVRLVNPTTGACLGPLTTARVTITDGKGPVLSPDVQWFPLAQPSGRTFRLGLDSWRFAGEMLWHGDDENVFNIREGMHRIEFLPAEDLLDPLPTYVAPAYYVTGPLPITGLAVDDQRENHVEIEWDPFPETPGIGSLTVVPGTMPSGAQWRRLGESTWRNPSTTETSVPAGKHWIEFKDGVAGHFAPGPVPVDVNIGGLATVTAVYRPRPATAILPQIVTEPDLYVSGSNWFNVPIAAQTGRFRLSFEMQPLQSPPGTDIDTLVGLAASPASAYTSLSAIVRANNGIFDGYKGGSGGGYHADNTLNFQSGQWYFIDMEVDVPTNTYQFKVTPPTGSPVQILGTAGFRTATAELRYLTLRSQAGSHKVRHIRLADSSPATAEWSSIPIPSQRRAFVAEFHLSIGSNLPYLRFGLSAGTASTPTVLLSPFEINVDWGYYTVRNTIVTLRVDPLTRAYSLECSADPGGKITGTFDPELTEIDHILLATDPLVGIKDMVLPPYEVAPSSANVPTDWLHIPIPPQTGRFAMTCEVVTNNEPLGSGDLIDGLIGLSDSKVTVWSNLAVALRAKLPNSGPGLWQAHTGAATSDGYSSENTVSVTDGKRYLVELVVDVPADRFRATVRPEGGTPMVISSDDPFRKAASEIRYVTLRNVNGRLAVSNIRAPLPAPERTPAAFTGLVESGMGFSSGVVVADHAVLTTARNVFDPDKLVFSRDITWRLPGSSGCPAPDAQHPSSVILVAGYASALLADPSAGNAADAIDVAVLAFRPMTVPNHDNAPGGGGFSGFSTDQGAVPWTAPSTPRLLAGFPMSTVTGENRGKLHQVNVTTATFTTVASGLSAMDTNFPDCPPGFEGAPLFVRQANTSYLPAAICLGTASGQLRFRAIDSPVADAIQQANSFQREQAYFQSLMKNGVYYIPSTVAGTPSPNRAHIFSDAIPSTATWTVCFSNPYDTDETTDQESTVSKGGQAVSVQPDDYYVEFGDPPPGYDFDPAQTFNYPKAHCLRRMLAQNSEWHLPPVYIAKPSVTWEDWQTKNFSAVERSKSSVIAPESTETFLGVANVIAYAFGFDPKVPKTWPADPATMTPGYPILRRPSPGAPLQLEFLRRRDSGLSYRVEANDDLSGSWPWALEAGYPNTSSSILTGASNDTWEYVRIPLTGLGPDAARKFVRVKVELAN